MKRDNNNNRFTIAIDKLNNRVTIDETVKGEVYFCPLCGEKISCKKGRIRKHHFAHMPNSNCHDWGDMSDWHWEWQELFPKDYREVIMHGNGHIHRADVFIPMKNTVIEFQHSPISNDEFNIRNSFYTDLGYRLIWVFDAEKAMRYETYKLCENAVEYQDVQKLLWKRKREWNCKLKHDGAMNVIIFLETNIGLLPYKSSTDEYAIIDTLTSFISRENFVNSFVSGRFESHRTIKDIYNDTRRIKEDYDKNIAKFGSIERWKEVIRKTAIQRKFDAYCQRHRLYI